MTVHEQLPKKRARQKKPGLSDGAARLRRRAERRLREQHSEAGQARTEADTKRLVHELQVHQIELEMQKEELQRARDEIEAGLEKYIDLYDFAPMGYLTLDREGTIQEANLTAAGVLGRERSHLIQRQLGRFFSAASLPIFTAFLTEVLEGKVRPFCEVTLAKKAKTAVEVRLRAAVAAAGRECRVMLEDITERKRNEGLLARSLSRFDGIISAAMDAIISINSHQRIVLFNSAAEKMFGIPAWKAVGEGINRFIPARFRAGHVVHVENYGKTGVSTRHMGGLSAVSGLRADGTEFPLEASISQVEVSGERLFTVILRDITERKLAAEAVRASREQLRALAARIQAAREEERTHAAREIHDVLAQELTGLKIDLAWLNRRLAGRVGAGEKRALREKVGAMMELTDQASQSVQRIAAELRPVVLDSLGLCAATKWVAAQFHKRTRIRCGALVPGQDLVLDRDRSTALFRILQESLTNVTRHAQATKVEIRLWREADEVVLTVGDNGRGIQPSELNDPHSMGLLGMRERASLLDGQCAIRAQAGGGTTVEVRLPTAPTADPGKNL